MEEYIREHCPSLTKVTSLVMDDGGGGVVTSSNGVMYTSLPYLNATYIHSLSLLSWFP